MEMCTLEGSKTGCYPVMNKPIHSLLDPKPMCLPPSILFLKRQSTPPHYPSEKTQSARLRTFSENWSMYCPIEKETMAAAGFFAFGFTNAVVCFYCDGDLHGWEIGQDPWKEHARWFPKCKFLQASKIFHIFKVSEIAFYSIFMHSVLKITPQPLVEKTAWKTILLTGSKISIKYLYKKILLEYCERLEIPEPSSIMERVQLALRIFTKDSVVKIVREELETSGLSQFPNFCELYYTLFGHCLQENILILETTSNNQEEEEELMEECEKK